MTERTTPTAVAELVPQLDAVLRRLEAGNPDGAAMPSTPAAHSAARNTLLASVDELEAYAGPALAGPVKVAAHAAVVEGATTAAELRTTRLELGQLAADAAQLEAAVRAARAVLVELGEDYVDEVRKRLAAEALAIELEAVITDEGRSSGRRMTAGMAASRIREAGKRAAKTAAGMAEEVLGQ